MADRVKAFDVWFVAANTVYKGVPYNVVADWVQQARLSAADMLRPAGATVAWKPVTAFELLADYLPRPAAPRVAVEPVSQAGGGAAAPAAAGDEYDAPELDMGWKKGGGEEDDDPDMIPLIDISLVLLIFFMMIRAAGALSPVDVPDMMHAGELSKDADAVTISVERRGADEVYYTVRVGEAGPKPEHANIPTPEGAIEALKAVLSTAARPPEVRIACRKDLPGERVMELVRDLVKLKRQNLINSFNAEVNEKAKKG